MKTNLATEKTVRFGTEPQKDDDGNTVFAWWLQTINDGNDEAIIGGYCATEVDCRNDANVWLTEHPDYTEAK